MRKPESVRVGAFDYRLSWDKNLAEAGAAGLTNPDNLMIAIDPGLALQAQQETLVHESLHGAWKQTPLRVTHPDTDSDSVGELIIQTISPIVYQLIVVNTEVIRWLRSS